MDIEDRQNNSIKLRPISGKSYTKIPTILPKRKPEIKHDGTIFSQTVSVLYENPQLMAPKHEDETLGTRTEEPKKQVVECDSLKVDDNMKVTAPEMTVEFAKEDDKSAKPKQPQKLKMPEFKRRPTSITLTQENNRKSTKLMLHQNRPNTSTSAKSVAPDLKPFNLGTRVKSNVYGTPSVLSPGADRHVHQLGELPKYLKDSKRLTRKSFNEKKKKLDEASRSLQNAQKKFLELHGEAKNLQVELGDTDQLPSIKLVTFEGGMPINSTAMTDKINLVSNKINCPKVQHDTSTAPNWTATLTTTTTTGVRVNSILQDKLDALNQVDKRFCDGLTEQLLGRAINFPADVNVGDAATAEDPFNKLQDYIYKFLSEKKEKMEEMLMAPNEEHKTMEDLHNKLEDTMKQLKQEKILVKQHKKQLEDTATKMKANIKQHEDVSTKLQEKDKEINQLKHQLKTKEDKLRLAHTKGEENLAKITNDFTATKTELECENKKLHEQNVKHLCESKQLKISLKNLEAEKHKLIDELALKSALVPEMTSKKDDEKLNQELESLRQENTHWKDKYEKLLQEFHVKPVTMELKQTNETMEKLDFKRDINVDNLDLIKDLEKRNENILREFEAAYSTVNFQTLVINQLEKRLERAQARRKNVDNYIKQKEEQLRELQLANEKLKEQVIAMANFVKMNNQNLKSE